MSKKNPAVPATHTRVVLKFDGTEYELSFGFNQLIEVERLTQRPYLEQVPDKGGVPTLELIRAMLFVALKRAGCKLTLEEIGERLVFSDLDHVFKTVMLAYRESKAVTPADPPPATPAS